MRKTIYIIGMLCFMLSCAEHDDIMGGDIDMLPISIGSNYPSTEVLTRASVDGGFVAGDEMGIFVVDRDKEGQPVFIYKSNKLGKILLVELRRIELLSKNIL